MRIHRGSKPTRGTDRGFTTIELMVVIGIVTMLLGILLVAIGGASRTAQAANTRALMNSMKTALVTFRNDIGYLPPVLNPLEDVFFSDPDDLRKLYPPSGPNGDWGDLDDVLPQWPNSNTNLEYDVNIQEGSPSRRRRSICSATARTIRTVTASILTPFFLNATGMRRVHRWGSAILEPTVYGAHQAWTARWSTVR